MRIFSSMIVAALAAVSLSAQAREAGELSIQAGAILVDPDASSSELALNGTAIADSSANVHNDTQLGITFRYMYTDAVAVELLAATPFSHDITADTGALGLGRVPAGDTKHLPPTLSVLYFPAAADSAFQPYAGVGLNWTTFFSEGVSSTLVGVLGDGSLDLDDSFGLGLVAGFDYDLADNLTLNAAIRYIDIGNDATFSFDSGDSLTVGVDIDPITYMIGIGYTF